MKWLIIIGVLLSLTILTITTINDQQTNQTSDVFYGWKLCRVYDMKLNILIIDDVPGNEDCGKMYYQALKNNEEIQKVRK